MMNLSFALKRRTRVLGLLAMVAGSVLGAPSFAAEPTTKLRISGVEVSFVAHLAQGLGYFEEEGLSVTLVPGREIKPHSYMMQAALHRGEIDASIHWLQHVVYGPANSAPVKAVMVLNNAPGVTVMVANRMKGEIRSGADFAGRRIAEGAGYATKSILTNYLAHREGLPLYSYTPVMTEVEGRREAVIKGLKRGDVDVMTFMEPMTSSLLETGMVSTLYDLTSGESTAKVLGSEWPAQSVFLTPEFIARNPEAVQKLVNALVRTMRFVNTHSAEQIVAKLPDGYFQGRDRAAEATRISSNMATFARGDYSLNSSAVKLVVDTTVAAPFDSSEEGHFRANSKKLVLNPGDLYDNRFVDKAMSEFP